MEAAAAQQFRPLSFQEDPLKSLAELRVKYAVDYRIKCRVGVTEPGENLEGRVVDARLAEGGHNVDAEERHPAHCRKRNRSS